ncbi:sensor histidine kinase [Paenibacillus nanensis]|uniref:Sensor histidine kinase n=1 Tax=Paenibacillus nanensis TaxID=393251 RepID=A0A3A1USN2_9BACL|nr:sensor histidine kinase [Paenibacillus nanensis]RIX51274.1 sensor histidine kinase [Paenibacillus nanensis]
MRRFFDRFKYNGLFVKMFIVMVVSIASVAVITTWTTINTSERVFLETFSITNSKVVEQIKSNMDAYNYAIVIASNNVLQSGSIRGFLTEGDGNSLSQMRAYYNMSQQIKRIHSGLDAYDVSIIVNGVNGRSFATDRTIWPISDKALRSHPITDRTLSEPRKLHYLYDDANVSGNPDVAPTIVASKALLDRTTGKVYGSMYFPIREQEFKRFYESFTSLGNDVAVMSGTGMILSSNRSEWIGQPSEQLLNYAKEIEKKGLPYMDAEMMDKSHVILSTYLQSLDLYVVNVIDKEAAIGQLTDTDAIVLTVMIIVAAALIIVFLISRRLTKSLTRLVKQISTISKYEFDHEVTVGGSYETRQLAQAFNSMLAELQVYVRELLETQKGQRNAELEALQQQINPHFLYNTLASVKFMVQQGSKEKAAETINALISLLQNAIGNVSATITLSQELINLKNYVFINHVRYGERIKMNYFVSPDCMGYHVPKLIIQPFIENAFFHGFNQKSEGNIYFMASKDGDSLVCEVADNGDGFDMGGVDGLPLPQTSRRQLFAGIGVKNVHDRIKLLYGEQYGVTIASEPGEGTRVKIRLPLIKG